jgi:hypothetical protein
MPGQLAARTGFFAIAALVAISAIGGCDGSSGSGGAVTQAGPRAAAAGGAAAPAARPQADAALPALSSAKIRTAQLTVAVKHGQSVAARANAAGLIAVRAGGEVDTDDRTSGAHASADLVLRVPPQQLIAVLGALARLGTERSRHLATQDVTAKVADVSSRVASAEQAIARLRQLYARAVKASDIVQIEGELSSRESDLESLQAQRRALSRETSTAVITLSLVSASAPPPPVHHRSGFLGGVRSGWDAFTRTMSALATACGAVLPFAALLLVLGLLGRVLWGHLRPRSRGSEGRQEPVAE